MVLLVSEMGVDEFEQRYADMSGVTVDFLHERNQFGAICNCEESEYQHWRMEHKDDECQ